jgi:hypothetical protein
MKKECVFNSINLDMKWRELDLELDIYLFGFNYIIE